MFFADYSRGICRTNPIENLRWSFFAKIVDGLLDFSAKFLLVLSRLATEMISIIKRNSCGKALEAARLSRDMLGGKLLSVFSSSVDSSV